RATPGREQVRHANPHAPAAALPFLGKLEEGDLLDRVLLDQADRHIIAITHSLKVTEGHTQEVASPKDVLDLDSSLAIAHPGANSGAKESRQEIWLTSRYRPDRTTTPGIPIHAHAKVLQSPQRGRLLPSRYLPPISHSGARSWRPSRNSTSTAR